MAKVGRPPGRTYSEMMAFVVTVEMQDAIKAAAERDSRTVSDWLRMLVTRGLTVNQAAALVAEDEAVDAVECVR